MLFLFWKMDAGDGFVLEQRVAEWKEEFLPLKEILQFYNLHGSFFDKFLRNSSRPYAWSMTVSSLDGKISFHERNQTGF